MTLKINKKEYYKMNDKWIALLVSMAIGSEIMVLKTQNEARALEIYSNSVIIVKEMSENEKFKDDAERFVLEASQYLQGYYSQCITEDLLKLLKEGFPEKTIIEQNKTIIH